MFIQFSFSFQHLQEKRLRLWHLWTITILYLLSPSCPYVASAHCSPWKGVFMVARSRFLIVHDSKIMFWYEIQFLPFKNILHLLGISRNHFKSGNWFCLCCKAQFHLAYVWRLQSRCRDDLSTVSIITRKRHRKKLKTQLCPLFWQTWGKKALAPSAVRGMYVQVILFKKQ